VAIVLAAVTDSCGVWCVARAFADIFEKTVLSTAKQLSPTLAHLRFSLINLSFSSVKDEPLSASYSI
jgi:hypothetical protein